MFKEVILVASVSTAGYIIYRSYSRNQSIVEATISVFSDLAALGSSVIGSGERTPDSFPPVTVPVDMKFKKELYKTKLERELKMYEKLFLSYWLNYEVNRQNVPREIEEEIFKDKERVETRPVIDLRSIFGNQERPDLFADVDTMNELILEWIKNKDSAFVLTSGGTPAIALDNYISDTMKDEAIRIVSQKIPT